MKIAVFSSKNYDRKYLQQANTTYGFDLHFFDFQLNVDTTKMAEGCQAVCIFVNDNADQAVLEKLAEYGVTIVALRCAGFNNVDLKSAKQLGLKVVRVPAYSPEAVAEHAVGLMMSLNRHIHRAYQRTRDANFSLEGLIGFNMHGRTAGIIGTGKIGIATMRILKGFGMQLLAFDPFKNPQVEALGGKYVSLDELFTQSDVISLHCPATPDNYHLLCEKTFKQMKDGVMIINTSRGSLINTKDAIEALKQSKIGALGLDVYENEQALFFEDKSNEVILDDVFRRISSCHNVLLTGHQAFLTEEALLNISDVTLANIQQVNLGENCPNQVE
ncbi:2-hydroxyacid dehydrogenase [Lonepinella sp. MS14437]|uniref:2-hydroxyacid dehydrogenase n=1 Tax=Lonepinella sp. MS14437 TaxID=3003620 RepID=UPI0036DA72BC